MTSQTSDPDREYQLIEKLELRIASAETEAKFENILQKFLAPLLLKLASETARNRDLTIKVCGYVNQRLKIGHSIALPVPALLKTFRESQNILVKRFTLIFLQQGLERLPAPDATAILPDVIKSSVPTGEIYDASDGKMWSIAFEYLLHVLLTWKVPAHGTKEDTELDKSYNLSEHQLKLLSDMLSHFLIYDPKSTTARNELHSDFLPTFERYFKMRFKVVLPIAKFIFTSIFSDEHRLVPATILSVDANEPASSLGDAMFKQCNFNYETDRTVDALFTLFNIGKPKLKIRVLALLNKSQRSTENAHVILDMVEKQLFQNDTGLEAAKLRAAVFNYLNWAVRASKSLYEVGHKLQSALKEYIELQGWPTMQEVSMSEIDLRAKAYEGIGLLARTEKQATTAESDQKSLDLIVWLFTSLRCDTTRDIRGSIDEALGRILNVVTIASHEARQKLKDVLLWNVSAVEGDEDPTYFLPTKNTTKYAAVRFANKWLSFADVDARYIDLLALEANERREIAEEALRGLDPQWHISNSRLSGAVETALEYPSFAGFIDRMFNHGGSKIIHNDASLAGAVVLGRNLLITEAMHQAGETVNTTTGWRHNVDALMHNDVSARYKVREYIRKCNSDSMKNLLGAALHGLSRGSSDCADIALELSSLSPDNILAQVSSQTIQLCQNALEHAATQQRAARIYGIILSLSEQNHLRASELMKRCLSYQNAIGQEAISLRGNMLATAYILTRMSLRGRTSETSEALFTELATLARSIILDGRDKLLKHAAYSVVGQISLCLSSSFMPDDDRASIMDVMFADAKKEDEVAISCIGRLVKPSFNVESDKYTDQIVDRLFALHEVRKAEFHFALGEAITVAALGFHSSSTTTEFDVDAVLPAWGIHPELFEKFLVRSIADCKTTKPSLKKAAGIWLLCLIQFCTDAKLLRPHLRDCQTAFGGLLNNRDEIVQETGSRGLSIVYEKGDKSLQDDLVRDLVQSFTGSAPKMSGSVDEDTQLFEAGALPTEGGQSVTTYKDIVSLATEMGDPSLVYRFMNMASNNAIWTSRAAFGRFGLSGVLADSTYLTENKKFYPKLFRYRFDPNPNVQRSMDEIWKALVKDSNKVIEENFDLIMDDLLKSIISGKEWRVREASCGAIADLVQGREVEKFEKYLDEIWRVAFKVLDDVKETVRLAAMKLCRTLTSMLIRNLEVGEGTTKRAMIMLNRAIPFLLQQMEGGSAQEVQQYAVVTLLEVVKKGPSRSIQPFAPIILETLVLSLSSLEHESINYLHLNADKYGLTAEKLDKMRVSSINSSPVSDAIERCLESLTTTNIGEVVDQADRSSPSSSTTNTALDPTQDAMQRLEKAFKTAIGLPSKVGLSRVMVTLVVRHHAIFRPFADRFAQLTRKYILDRNATISVSFSMALAYIMRLASEKEVRATSEFARKLYFQSEELSHRSVAGEIIQAISKASNDVFMNYATIFLPFAFIGCNDIDEEVRSRFEPPWKENIGGSRTFNLYLRELVSLISTHIGSSLWPIKQACCLSVAQLITAMEAGDTYTEIEARLLWSVLEDSLSGKTWDGKDKVISAFPQFVKRARPLWNEKGKQMKVIAIREAKRNNAAYRPYAITALGDFVSVRADLDLTTEVVELLTNVAEELSEDGEAMDVDKEENSGTRVVEETWIAIIKCLFQTLTEHANLAVLEATIDLVKKSRSKRYSKIDVEVFYGVRQFINQATVRVGTEAGARAETSSLELGGQARVAGSGQPVRRAPETSSSADHLRTPVAAFLLQLLPITLLSDTEQHPFDNEKTRKSRVDLATTIAKSGLLDNTSTASHDLLAILDTWSRTERSRPLKTDLDVAAGTIRADQIRRG